MPDSPATILTSCELRSIVPSSNTRKFYRITLYTDNSIQFEWGRIGKTPRSITKNYGSLTRAASHHYESKINEKLRKGYFIYNGSFDVPTEEFNNENNSNNYWKTIEYEELSYE